MATNFLLATKLSIPPARPKLLPRPHLYERLHDGLAPGQRLILVSAPAGYGKSTLIAGWLHQLAEGTAGAFYGVWISLDEGDNEPVRFLNYLIAALRKVDSRIGQSLQSMLGNPQVPPFETAMASLINDLSEYHSHRTEKDGKHGIVLALDDYQRIQAPYLHQSIKFLLERQPPELHLVLISREDPPLPLPNMRARGEMIEIRARELRFTVEETIALYNQVMKLGLADEWIRSLETRTEGWIAGLQLAALSLQGQTDTAAFLEHFRGSHRYLIDYLMDEVLGRQTEQTRQFLMQTSILGRFNAALCQAVTGYSDSQERLSQLEESNLFLIPLDEHRQWYRYHHLFGDVLRLGLDPAPKRDLHQKASDWFEANGYLQEAIEHALLSENYLQAGRLVQEAANALVGYGGIAFLLEQIHRFPEELVREEAGLLSLKAWCLYFTGQLAESARAMSALEKLSEDSMSPRALGRLLSLKTWFANSREEDTAVAMAGEALGLVGESDPLLQATTWLPLGHALRRTNSMAGALQAYREAASVSRKAGLHLSLINATNSLVISLTEMGRAGEALSILEEARRGMVDGLGRSLEVTKLLSISEAVVRYEMDQPEQAVELALAGKKAGQQILSNRILGGEIERVLIQAHAALGDPAAAFQVIHEERMQGGHQAAWIAPLMDALEADLNRMYGDLDAAERWAKTVQPPGDRPFTVTYELIFIIYARILIETKQRKEAEQVLTWLEAAMRQGGRNAALVSVSILQAHLELARNNRPAALKILQNAVKLAAPGGYMRRFLDERVIAGQLVKEFQPQLANLRSPAIQPFLEQLFRTCQGGDAPCPGGRQPGEKLSTGSQGSSAGRPGLVEPLSEQEVRVLRLLSTGKTNQEIADILFITQGTVKWHVHNIFGKLGARNRTEAISQAQIFRIL